MYVIHNNKRGKVILGDLNVILNQREEKDLDLIFSRETIYKSDNLKRAIFNGAVTVIRDETEKTPSPPQPILVTVPQHDPSALADMESRIKKEMAKHLSHNSQNTPKETSDVAVLAAKLDLILDALSKGQLSQNNSSKTDSDEEDSFVDDDKMLDLHKRAVERVTRGTSGKVESKSEVKNVDLSKQIDDLEGLV